MSITVRMEVPLVSGPELIFCKVARIVGLSVPLSESGRLAALNRRAKLKSAPHPNLNELTGLLDQVRNTISTSE
jgi:hypothetical protein